MYWTVTGPVGRGLVGSANAEGDVALADFGVDGDAFRDRDRFLDPGLQHANFAIGRP